MERPADLFDRVREWDDLVGFVDAPGPGLRIGVVSGRRRQGKSYLLRRLSRAADGLYHQAQALERTQALDRFADDVAYTSGIGEGLLRFTDWETAFRAALGYPRRATTGTAPTPATGPRRLLVLDELPYLLEHSPEIPSVLQALYDEARDQDAPPATVLLCGSSLSIMTRLLSGTQALRGRATLDMTIHPFDYRTAAQYWGLEDDPELAFLTSTVFGGTAGYRPLAGVAPASVADFPTWLGRTVLNSTHALYQEKDYLLREDTRLTDKQVYNAVLAAVAARNHIPGDIARTIGRDTNSLRHPLKVLTDAGFLLKVDDAFNPRRSLYLLADPIVRFSETVVEPYRPLLEEGLVAEVWARADLAVRSNVYGPQFEHLARRWTSSYAEDRFGVRIGQASPGVINDAAERSQHELDVVACPVGTQTHQDSAPIVVLGEAKATARRRTLADLARLERIRDLLVARGRDAAGAHLALFSRDGFDDNLVAGAAGRDDVHLLDLAALYA